MKDDYQEILSLPDGIFRVKYHRLSLKSIRSLRSRWMSDIFKARREIAKLHKQIRAKKQLITQKEAMVNKLTDENIRKFIEAEANRKQELQEKANKFLRGCIGDEAFTELQKKGSFSFIGLDGKTYRIKQNGELQVDGGSYWYHCCYIKDNQLPLPDVIAAVFASVTHSKHFQKETQRTKTKEEVTE